VKDGGMVDSRWQALQLDGVPSWHAELRSLTFGDRDTLRHNSDIEADVALSRCAPSGPRSLTPVVDMERRVKLASSSQVAFLSLNLSGASE